jgi:hypothetical protein
MVRGDQDLRKATACKGLEKLTGLSVSFTPFGRE